MSSVGSMQFFNSLFDINAVQFILFQLDVCITKFAVKVNVCFGAIFYVRIVLFNC